jgi:hypothetical protein
MKSLLPLLLSATILSFATACAPSGDEAAASGGDALGEAECQAVLGHARGLMGIPDDVMSEAMDAEMRTCAEEGTLSQEEYDCGMAATSAQEFAACGIDIT